MIVTSTSKVKGHVLITDKSTGEIFLDKDNAIHFANFSEAIAMSLANRSSGFIQNMVFGNGAAAVSGIGAVTYFPPNTTGDNASLYNQTYSQVVNDASPLNSAPASNYISVNHTSGNVFSDIVITCLLDYNQPAGQDLYDDSNTSSGTFIFNELGLTSFDPTSNGNLLTHVVFHPIQKALNRQIEVKYTLRRRRPPPE